MTTRLHEGGGVTGPAEDDWKEKRHRQDLRMRLDKLSRTYDLTTMKIFMSVEALGEGRVYSVYDPECRENWETFLFRRDACRLDLARHERTRESYRHFLSSVSREEQARQFFHAMTSLFLNKGAVNVFKGAQHENAKNLSKEKTSKKRSHNDLENESNGFCTHLVRLFDRKLENWFDAFEAVNVCLTAHVKVSGLVRVLTGQVDALCRHKGMLYALNVKVTGMSTPRPMDVAELGLIKVMVIQNGLALPEQVVPCVLTCHLGEDRPVLRLWEYRPTSSMEVALREADIDRMIAAGTTSRHYEFWRESVAVVNSARDPVKDGSGSHNHYTPSLHSNRAKQHKNYLGGSYDYHKVNNIHMNGEAERPVVSPALHMVG